MEISIIICTRNRAHLLQKLIYCFDHDLIVPQDLTLDIIIVDNNSVDNTRKVIDDLSSSARSYKLRYVFEKKSGLSHARNRGIREARYKMLCFLDDDIIPDPLFIKALADALENHPEVLCFTPRIIKHNENMPDWYRIDGKYPMLKRGGFDRGPHSRLLTQKDGVPIGACMIISRTLFSRFGFFNPAFGYDFSKPMMIPGEESEFFFLIRAAEIPIYYIADAVINHCPDAEKYDIMTLCKTYEGSGYWYGTADARNLLHKNIKTLAGFPRSYYKRLIITGFNFIFNRFSSNKTIKYYHRFEWERTLGYFKGYSDFRKKKGS